MDTQQVALNVLRCFIDGKQLHGADSSLKSRQEHIWLSKLHSFRNTKFRYLLLNSVLS
jgi:hypothetical protein